MTSNTEITEMPPQYDAGATERALYEAWERAGVFTGVANRSARVGGDREPFVVIMPPPNVTAVLHTGHGLNNTVQDVIVRWRRMAGDEALWLPGTDHAGIATQNVIEKQLAAEGKSRNDLGRDAFVKRTADFVDKTGGEILQQLRAIGSSADWTRTAYTLSPELSHAVREAFVQLYERGLIYRGHRVIHWCPRCLTSLSDEEAQHTEEDGRLYHIRYDIIGTRGKSVTVATTRPETMLGDVALAVHPEDERYAKLVGKKALLPIANIEIPIIADEYVDREFGTGVVKITPAHDPNDFEVGLRHKLPVPVVMTPDAKMDNLADAGARVPAALIGVDRFDARKRIVKQLEEGDLLVKSENHRHAVRHCYRCDTVVEPRLSDQWFVKMKDLAEPALAGFHKGEVRILPERWEAVYVHWMENIRDWNISRQLWWGHRIPVWYCDKCSETIVSREDVTACTRCGGAVRQDEDVLDTWFSSWLFPISTLGWPDKSSKDLAAFYPTDDLVTASEILFFWVARMIMAGYAFMDAAPFHTVYIHGTVRDTEHKKMSKSLGNGIDPLDVVRLFGADALRYTVIAGLGMGADLVLDPEDLERSFAPGRNFVTKLWNIGRFLLGNVGEGDVKSVSSIPTESLTLADRWILSRLDAAVSECSAALGPARPAKGKWKTEERQLGLRLSEYAETARRFVWNEVADWYVESVKGRLQSQTADGEVARSILVHVFDYALRLLHPIVPFITEDLWQRLPGRENGEFLARAKWPAEMARSWNAEQFETLREAVNSLRQLRADYSIAPGKQIQAVLASTKVRELFETHADIIGRMTRTQLVEPSGSEESAHILLSDGTEILVPLDGMIDVAKECEKMRTEVTQVEAQLKSLIGRLNNESFTSKAPAKVVEGERQKQQDLERRCEQLTKRIGELCGS
ncbi:MAG: valine--tRNA ligase [Gemmatimonadaceae bacterium]|nr:valine--tRNA ligase [Gemmatimonadaceae bacterium]